MMRAVLTTLVLAVAPLTAQQPIDFVAQHRVVDASFSPDGRQIAYTIRTADRVQDRFRDENAIIPTDGGAPEAIGGGRAIRFSPNGVRIARLVPVGGLWQLAVRDSLHGTDRVLTSFPLGVQGFRFSPSGGQIALTADGSAASAVGTAFDGGDARGRLALYVVDLATDSLRRLSGTDLALGALFPEQPNTVPFDWISDSRIVLSARLQGAAESVDGATLHLIDVGTATRRDLAGTGGRWVAPVVSPNREWIAFSGQPVPTGLWPASELIVMRADGTGLRRLTIGLDRDVGDVMWSDDSKSIWFATEDRGTRNLHRIEIKDGKLKSETTGTHLLMLADVSLQGDMVLAIRATPSSAGSLVRFPAGKPAELRTVVGPGTDLATGELEQFEIRDEAGRPIDSWLHRPPGFTLEQRAPLLIDIHGGPHAMAGAGYAPWAVAHAANGWLVLRVNARGSTGYGFDLANGVTGGWPNEDIADLRAVLRDVIARGLVDTTRIAVVGTGAGAVEAVALARVEPLVRRVIVRCAGSGWLPGGAGYDAPLWSEWHASRPLRLATPHWESGGFLAAIRGGEAPTLVIEGTPIAPGPLAFGESLHSALGRVGAPTRFVRIPTASCAAAGPATQAALIEMELRALDKP